jgi:hypothetical protein
VPARTAKEAEDSFTFFFRESLSVITNAYLLGGLEKGERVLLYEPPPRLERKNGTRLFLSIVQTYTIVKLPDDGGFKAHTTSYYYSALVEDQQRVRREILAFHWHPESTPKLKWPHLHVIPEQDEHLPYIHFPTGRCAIEDFVYMLIRDLKVKARKPYDEWKKILAKNRRAFATTASWLYREI